MQEARLAECEHMLVAVDLANWLNDGSAAVQAVVICYGLLAPLIFHQIACVPVVQVCITSSISYSNIQNNKSLCENMSVSVSCYAGATKMLDSFGGKFKYSQRKMD